MAKLAPRFRPFSWLYVPETHRELVPEINDEDDKEAWMLDDGMERWIF